MEAGGKDCEEETLQTAFKKLRVDAESLPGAVSVSEAMVPRAASRACLDSIGAKPKLSCPKDNWHGCMRKTSRGASRTQRRRRSKSPILHPPKFTYCSTAASSVLSTPSGCLKHQRLAVPEPVEPRPAVDGRLSCVAVPAQKELPSSGTSGHISPLVFGSHAEYETHVEAVITPQEMPTAVTALVASSRQDEGSSGAAPSSKKSGPRKSACDGAESVAGAPLISGTSEAADFRALSELSSSIGSAESPHGSCFCAWRKSSDSQDESQRGAECQCQSSHQGWAGVEVYSFTGLRNVISECEKSLPSHEDSPRTLSASSNTASASSLSSGSPRSCSEQARAYVDDITIEDLSGYMEYYLYIPKKMSHMAEMMYT
uniref:oxidative stress-responsive serine-rich protein 1 n=1 Tax=Scatophagus argus TaxID=75038 RepID=UPI001ED83D0E|nr:oxidative stress-responsive serine-rich protein 1 [Scatophagus argus]XP_046241192.1 oxidative stress-responsive serine-rich protein 1 [Scatophagus argus]XP_046241193.1 oxidative stress-responsive serine-rich protein 1 [Scatophagus argus]